jgi:hypothetical protein
VSHLVVGDLVAGVRQAADQEDKGRVMTIPIAITMTATVRPHWMH